MKNEMTEGVTEIFSDPILQMARDTLSTLNDYSEVLEGLSVKASDLVGETEFQEGFLKLIEGIQTFADSITQVKAVLHRGFHPATTVLESDLTSILKDLLESQEKGDLKYEKLLLKTHLPANLTQWRATGIPAIQQLRDC